MKTLSSWLALMIGNSRLHWAYFEGDRLDQTWNSPHRAESQAVDRLPLEDFPESLAKLDPKTTPIFIASVVPVQTRTWQSYPCAQFITLSQVPLQDLYPSLGIDRALGVLGLGTIAHFPSLVIDGGTALTITGVDGDRNLVGGAILPGINLQRQSLVWGTASLPPVNLGVDLGIDLGEILPPRWAKETSLAIASGIIYSHLAGIRDFIRDWQQQYPTSAIALTGGDGALLYHAFRTQVFDPYPTLPSELMPILQYEPNLIFLGIKAIISQKITK
jgi:type III pantothenate kinase